jgi:outer membrane lipoprotein SlyB
MNAPTDAVIERIKARELAGIFWSRETLDAAADALLRAGFDRLDISLISRRAAREALGFDIPATELPEVPVAPRRPFFSRDDIVIAGAMGIGILMFAGAAIGAYAVVASGGGTFRATVAAVVGTCLGTALGLRIFIRLRRDRIPEVDPAQGDAAELVLLVQVRSHAQEAKAERILCDHHAAAIRAHEIEIEKRAEDLPLSSLRIDPWLGDERLGEG